MMRSAISQSHILPRVQQASRRIFMTGARVGSRVPPTSSYGLRAASAPNSTSIQATDVLPSRNIDSPWNVPGASLPYNWASPLPSAFPELAAPRRSAFDPAVHLAPFDASHITRYQMSQIGYSSQICDFAMSEPFQLLSDAAIAEIRANVIENPEIQRRCTYSSSIAPCVLRNLARESSFVADLWGSDEIRERMSAVAQYPLQPHPMLMERAHVNVQNVSPHTVVRGDSTDKPVFGWHYDSQPFVCIMMLSDIPADGKGGETLVKVRRNGKDEVVKLQFPGAGYAYLLQGSAIEHCAMPALNYQRMTMITSFIPADVTKAVKCDATDLHLSATYSDKELLRREYLDYRKTMVKRFLEHREDDLCDGDVEQGRADLELVMEYMRRTKEGFA